MVEFPLLTQAQLDELLDRAMEELFPYGVGFVRLNEIPGTQPVFIGSGTLVVVDGLHGILTADHVLTALPTAGLLGLAFGGPSTPGANRFAFDCGLAERFRIAPASGDDQGPDLGLLALPPDAVSALAARASFYDITRHQAEVLAAPRPIEMGGWIILGIVDEWTTMSPGERGFRHVQQFTTVCGGSVVSREE